MYATSQTQPSRSDSDDPSTPSNIREVDDSSSIQTRASKGTASSTNESGGANNSKATRVERSADRHSARKAAKKGNNDAGKSRRTCVLQDGGNLKFNI